MLGEDGAPFFDYTRPVAFLINEKVWVNNHIHVLKPYKTVNSSFLVYYLNNVDYKTYINGSILNKLTQSNMNTIAFIVPPLEEQEKIADFLDKQCTEIDAILTKTRDSIAEYKKLKQAVITQAVTKGVRGERPMKDSGIEWVKKLPIEWRIIPSKYLFRNSDVRRQVDDEQLTASQKYGIITQKAYMELEKSKIVLANKGLDDWKHVEPNDFIISLRSFQGGLEMSEIAGCITWHYIVLKPCKQIVSKYYKWLFKSEIYIKALQRTCNFIRDGQDLRYSNFVQVPLFEPTIEEQQEIAEYLDKKCSEIDILVAKKERYVIELENYKKSLIYEYVTGKKEVMSENDISFEEMKAAMMCRMIELGLTRGRVQLAKGLYIADGLLGINNKTQYVRYVHGPYDTQLEEYENVMVQKGWFNIKKGNSVEYLKAEKFNEYRKIYDKAYNSVDNEIQRICAFLSPMKTSQTERVATLFAAWNDFILDGVTPTDKQIIEDVRTNWTSNKANSPEETWLRTLEKMKRNNIIPTGKGLHTVKNL